jgi:ribosomal protein S18 acetylase RimI-like enzyme
MISITVAHKADLPIIRTIAESTWPIAYQNIISPAQIDYMLEQMYHVDVLEKQFDSGHQFLMARVEQAVVGFAGFELNYQPKITKLHKLYILPEAHGKQLGSMLLDSVCDQSKSAGMEKILLNVNKSNPAYHFYLKKKFTIQQSVILDIGAGFVMDDYIMEREL